VANLKVVEGVDSQTYKENIFPIVGTIMPFSGSVAPTGWLLCNGSTFVETTYPELYVLLGNSNTLPDLRNKYLLGVTSSESLKTTGGNVGHAHSTTYALSGETDGVAIDHGHGANYNGASYENAYHEHTGYYNSSIYGGSTFGNFVFGNQGNMTAPDHSHNGGAYAFYYGSNPAHAHNFNSVVSNNLAPAHFHTFNASANQATLGSNTQSTLPLTRYINFIMKAG
jgi:microcystin-dependent protein